MKNNITKGTWYVERTSSENADYQARVLCNAGKTYHAGEEKDQIYIIAGEPQQRNGQANIHVEANAQLIADAGNVRQQIPFDLPELLKQRNELLEMVKMLNQVNPSFSLYDEAKKLITKCEGRDNG